MGISGKYVESFDNADLACVADLHLNSDYPHFFFTVKEVTSDRVRLMSHRNGEEMWFNREHKDEKNEFVVIKMMSSFERMVGRSPTMFKIYPMKEEKDVR
jgi:hypothetical protein